MSTQSVQIISRPKHPAHPRPVLSTAPPPLNAGDRLSRAEFERRYQAHPEIKKAELIEGVVHMESAVRFEQHGRPHSDVVGWLSVYRAATPGVLVGDNATVRFDFENEVQPDALLRLDPVDIRLRDRADSTASGAAGRRRASLPGDDAGR